MNGQYNIWNKWDPLKTVMLGDCYPPSFFRNIKNHRIRGALTQIAEETQEELSYFESVLKEFGCTVIRPSLDHNDSILNYTNDANQVKGFQGVPRSPLQPRDHQLIIGNYGLITGNDHPAIRQSLLEYSSNTKINLTDQPLPEFKYDQIMCPLSGDWPSYNDYKNNYKSRHFFKPHVWKELTRIDYSTVSLFSSANVFMIGNRAYVPNRVIQESQEIVEIEKLPYFKKFKLFFHNYDGHTDGNFHPIKPGAILSLFDVQNYNETFPSWDVCYFPDQSWKKVRGFLKIKNQVAGKWWVPGQEDNDEFTNFVETWLKDWVGYVEETVFDVNVLVLDEHHVCVSNLNPTVVDFLKKHKMEPVHIPWKHRYFWDGGLHCITLDLYREGQQQDYFI